MKWLIASLVALLIGVAVYFALTPRVKKPDGAPPYYFERNVGVENVNVYQEPDLGSTLLGSLSESSDLIETTDVEKGFYHVNFGEQSGWIDGGLLVQAQVPVYKGTNLPKALKCYGEEPFWEVSLSDLELEFSYDDFSAETVKALGIKKAGNAYDVDLGENGILTITQETCRSTMVDNAFNWRLEYNSASDASAEPLYGCCHVQK